MRIALFSETYLPQINGVATHVKTLKEGMEALGHQVLVVTADPKAEVCHMKEGVLRCPAAELKDLYGYGMAPSYNLERMRLIQAFSPDIAHTHTEFGIGSTGLETARKLKIPFIYTLHTMWDDYLHYVASPTLQPVVRKMIHRYLRYFASQADAIIGPSVKSRDFLHHCGVKREIEVIPNAVELEQFSRDRTDPVTVKMLRQFYNIQNDDTVICFCGRLGQEKSVDVLIRFFAQCRQKEAHLKLLLIGDGPALSELKELTRRLNAGSAVIFTGAVPHESVREVYACSDLYATASRSEVNSISMLEAMSMGLPVLQRLDEANPGQVTVGVNGYVFRTAEEFSAILLRFRNSSHVGQARMQTSTANSVKGLHPTGLARQMEAIYLRLATCRPASLNAWKEEVK